MSPLNLAFDVLAFAAFGCEAGAFFDALRRPGAAFIAAGKRTKLLWLLVLGVAAVVGLGYALLVGSGSVLSILPVAAFVAAAVYLADVRPNVKQIQGGRSRSGPYGPW